MKKFIKRHALLTGMLAAPIAVRHALLKWRLRPASTTLERMGRIFRSNVVFEVEEFDGVFSINPRSHLLHRVLQQGYYEPRVSGLFFSLLRPEDDVLDVGANVGFYTVGGAKKLTTGRLFAVEPTAEAFARLSENVKLNSISNKVILFKGLIGANKGEAAINYVPGLEEYSSVNVLEHAATRDHQVRSEAVPIERLDDLVVQYGLRPGLIKVDVEGSEYAVFDGARDTLTKFRPTVISELWRAPSNSTGRTAGDVIELFEKLDYVVKDAHDIRAKPGLPDIGEIVCIPKEKYSRDLLL